MYEQQLSLFGGQQPGPIKKIIGLHQFDAGRAFIVTDFCSFRRVGSTAPVNMRDLPAADRVELGKRFARHL